jgi:hypothetical protein
VAALPRLRRLCLALPEAEERLTWDCATFRVRGRIFAMHVTDGAEAVWCKAPPGVQTMLVEAAPGCFFVPPYVGRNGWIGVRLGRGTDWVELAGLVERSWCMTAPKRLAAARAQPASTNSANAHRNSHNPATNPPSSGSARVQGRRLPVGGQAGRSDIMVCNVMAALPPMPPATTKGRRG